MKTNVPFERSPPLTSHLSPISLAPLPPFHPTVITLSPFNAFLTLEHSLQARDGPSHLMQLMNHHHSFLFCWLSYFFFWKLTDISCVGSVASGRETMSKISRGWVTFVNKARYFIIVAWLLGLLQPNNLVFNVLFFPFVFCVVTLCSLSFVLFSSSSPTFLNTSQAQLGPYIPWLSWFQPRPWHSTPLTAQKFVSFFLLSN